MASRVEPQCSFSEVSSYEPPTVADLFPNRPAPGNPVRFVAESTATNAAAATSEAGAKPESTLVFSETTEPVRKVATILPISDEMLEDAPAISAYLNQRLTLFVRTTEEAQILLHHLEVQGLIGHARMDTKAAGVWTPQTAEHRHDFYEGRFVQRRRDELPALTDPGEHEGLLSSGKVQADGPMRGAVLQDVTEDGLVGEAQYVVEVLHGILGVTAGVRAAEDGDRTVRPEQVAQRVCQLRRLCKRAYENEVDLVWQLLNKMLKTPGSRGSGCVRVFFIRRGSSLCRHGEIRYDDTPEERGDGVPQGGGDASDQSRGSRACGAGGRTQAPRGWAHRDLRVFDGLQREPSTSGSGQVELEPRQVSRDCIGSARRVAGERPFAFPTQNESV